MSNETKRDVFEAVLNRLAGYQVFFNGWPRETLDGYKKRYDNALPDDLPVIPKEVGEYIQWGKSYDIQLYMMYVSQLIHRPGFKKLTDDAKSWIISSSNIFARAWLLGVWRVEETGEIVKLEAEK
ncbi:hypothetical protein [Lacticaseibacillus phage P7.1]|uniref:hypothetical protein n=1 Tax=Lacticaseibacillus paracasei TaxID=1597 RepID=UPI002916E945|nr:hypothetical protein [Lacticaseibacillus paracasei]WBM89784.1 hypothetical protein [Lacticaseibacillus phage P7.1]WNX21131.1 hypothetical protein RWA18_08510 [Lacticaseibacillus paracasei]